ncbi:hypothetical protein BXO87_02310 [Bacillus sp. GZB]|uniref:hypothetical protein n=1 Tax=Bacillus TaxID=1386 RepID=UPI0009757983|nr:MULTISPECIES: hypothetical protein [Bacillus]MCZ4246955.1 hypothetical protein [Bacillus amyloliquefaciens]OMQ06859.1 hypothetical protein BXO87_02310 [Bacillus sp. GZB]
MTERLNGFWVNREDPKVRITIPRVYKRRNTVDFFYSMCNLTGGGTIDKRELVRDYIKEAR